MSSIDALGNEFITNTKYENLNPSPETMGELFPKYLQPANPAWEKINLPQPKDITLGHFDLRMAIEERRSIRRYADTYIHLDELSFLLWMTQGVKKVSEKSGMTLRTVPSAGARHPFETYMSINKVTDLKPGLYHFLADIHQLEIVRLGSDVNLLLTAATLQQKHVANSAVTFIWVAVPYRTSWRYSSRAYRYLYMDAGHVCQNLSLAAEAIDCGICPIGAYHDDLVNELVKVDGTNQFAIYLASLGKKPQEEI